MKFQYVLGLLIVILVLGVLFVVSGPPSSGSELEIREVNGSEATNVTDFSNLSKEQRNFFRKAVAEEDNRTKIPGYIDKKVWRSDVVVEYRGSYYSTRMRS